MRTFALSTLALVALSSAAHSDQTIAADSTVTAVLLRQTQELFDAIASGKTAVWDRYLDENVRYIDESGNVATKKEMVEGIRPLPHGVSGTIQVTEYDVALHGDVAVATHVEIEDENYHGHELHCRYRTTDTWRRTDQGWRLIAAQVLALRADPPAIPIRAAARREYCGTYALTPAIQYEIRSAGDSLFGQQSGREPEVLRAEAPDVLFVLGRPRYRYIVRRGDDGRVIALVQRREAWDLVWKRTN
jgi:ketosteroid isomerase-like protein